MPKTAARKSLPPTKTTRRTVKPQEKVIEDPIRYLFDNGLIGYLNRTVFHSLGIPVEVGENPQTGRMEITRMLDHRDNPVDVFTKEQVIELDEKFGRYMRSEGTDIMRRRKKAKGFVTQLLNARK